MPQFSICEISMMRMIRAHGLNAKQLVRIFGIGLTKAHAWIANTSDKDPKSYDEHPADEWFRTTLTAVSVAPIGFASWFVNVINDVYSSRISTQENGSTNVRMHLAQAVKESAEALCRHEEAVEDGQITAEEEASELKEISEARVALDCAEQAIRNRATKPVRLAQ